jgi:hypothetical protein
VQCNGPNVVSNLSAARRSTSWFQSIAGTEAANKSFGVSLALLREAHDAARSLNVGMTLASERGSLDYIAIVPPKVASPIALAVPRPRSTVMRPMILAGK